MKKLISAICIALTLLALTACGKFTCDACKQEKRGRHEVTIGSEKGTVCGDCYDKLEKIGIVK